MNKLKMSVSGRSRKCDVFQEHFGILVNAVSPVVGEVARKAFDERLIFQDSLHNALNLSKPPKKRAAALLGEIQSKIDENDANFDSFLSILQSIPTLNKLSGFLTEVAAPAFSANVQAKPKRSIPISHLDTQDTGASTAGPSTAVESGPKRRKRSLPRAEAGSTDSGFVSYGTSTAGPSTAAESGEAKGMKEWLMRMINSGRYPGLKWLDDDHTVFAVPWSHTKIGGHLKRSRQLAALYREWAIFSGEYDKSSDRSLQNDIVHFWTSISGLEDVMEIKSMQTEERRVYRILPTRRKLMQRRFRRITPTGTVKHTLLHASLEPSAGSVFAGLSSRAYAAPVRLYTSESPRPGVLAMQYPNPVYRYGSRYRSTLSPSKGKERKSPIRDSFSPISTGSDSGHSSYMGEVSEGYDIQTEYFKRSVMAIKEEADLQDTSIPTSTGPEAKNPIAHPSAHPWTRPYSFPIVPTGLSICGVEECAETQIDLTGSSQTLHFRWKGYGLSLHILDRCLPVGVHQCTINISVSLAGQYEFPEGSHLVSAVYWLRCKPSCKFTKAISVEIEHCAPRGNAAKLSVVRSRCTQKQLPYSFKKLGGVFTEHSSYGYIKLESFSGIAVVQDGSEEREYCASLYYLERTRLNPQIHFEIHFVVVWNTETHLTNAGKHYKSKGAVQGPDLAVKFESETISLDVPPEGSDKGAWQIVPLTPLVVSKEQVDSFKPGHRIPSCQMQALLNRKDKMHDTDELPVLTRQVRLQGAKEPFNSLTISFIPSSNQAADSRVFVHTLSLQRKLKQEEEKPTLKLLYKELYKIAYDWENIGVLLEIDDGQLKALKKDESTTCDCLREMLRLWLNRVSPPPTWQAVVEAIEQGHTELAQILKQKYMQ